MRQKTTIYLATVLLFNLFVLICVKSSLSTQQQVTLANEVWVDDNFNESTPGWGVTRFQTIQTGINAVTNGGTAHVANGSYYENVAVNHTVFLVGENEVSTIIDGNYTSDSALVITANGVSVEGFAIQNCIYLGEENGGINVVSSHNNISNVYFTQNWIDIALFGINNIISSCNMDSSFWNIKVFANNNSILRNHFNVSYSAITLTSANGNSIEDNTITDYWIGISLYESTQNKIVSNLAFNCSQNALRLESYSTNNTFTRNMFSNCSQGVNADATSGANKLYHNRFINNTVQASIGGSENKWDNDYPSGGNYWSDYSGTDANGDFIGDTPYTIDENNADMYPFMYFDWNPCDINHDLKVDMKDIASVARAFGTIPDDPKWDPRADITGTVPLVPDGRVDMRDIGLVAKNFGKKY